MVLGDKMPTSQLGPAATVIAHIKKKNPDSVLDVGSGFGRYGFLLREYLECWQGRWKPTMWVKRIEAVEAWAPYTELPWYPLIYDEVHVCDVREIQLDKYGLVLFSDVIEHMPKKDGQALLDQCRSWIVTTPNYKSVQGAVNGNPFERHLSQWTTEDFTHHKIVENIIIGWGEK